MPRAIIGDIPLTKSYIPKVSKTPDISSTIANFYKPIEDRCIHEGRVVDQLYYTSNHIDRSVFTNEWDLSSLAFFQETEGPYHTDLPSLDEIHQFLGFKHVDSNRIIKNKPVILTPNQVLTKEVREDLKRWEELIHENVFSLGGHRDHLPACLSYILYCILAERQYNLAYFFVKRIESVMATPKAHLPYGKLENLKVIVECQKLITPSHLHPLVMLDLPRIKKEMMKMKKLHVLVLPPPLPISTLFNHLITKDMTFLLLRNKMMIFSSSVKLSCSINHNKSMRKLEVDSNHSAKLCEESSERKRNKDESWIEPQVIDEDEVIPEDTTSDLIDEFQNADKHIPTIYDYARMMATLNDVMSNQFKDAEEYAYHLEQTKNYMENQIVWESRHEDIKRSKPHAQVFYCPQRNPNEPPRITEVVRITTDQQYGLDYMEQIIMMRENGKPGSFSKADFKYLNKNGIEDLYYLCLNKREGFHENKLKNSLITFIRSCVMWERVNDF
ncbi:hypothetical protein Tco_1057974 [Tanacetum coccineum]|uniref:Uncharacterized protein n=1 Tax=Tanacetum coccineum TaxID=301880 RepID=A0ABQ5H8T7_9ASTR